MAFAISLNGPDNVGKTTQIALLPSHFTISKVGGLHDNDKAIGELQQQGLLKEWWWNSTPEEFVCSIFGALARRYWNSIAAKNSEIAVFDRGIAMFEVVAIAAIAIKNEDSDLGRARAVLDVIMDEQGLRLPREELAILMKHGETIEDSVRITMSREDNPEDKRYKLYQRLLQSELQNQEAAGVYQHTIPVTATDSIGDVQNKLRQVVFNHTKNLLFLPMMHTVDCIYAFGGLSESGKSTVAEAFCNHYGAKQAFRAKIVYFNSVISEMLGETVYELPEKEQALYLFHELERFLRAHYWLRVLTIESLHRDSVTRWLKSWLGSKFQVVYIDMDHDKRLQRSLVKPEEFARNDELKLERVVAKILLDADLVLDNNGTLAESMALLLLFAEGSRTKHEDI